MRISETKPSNCPSCNASIELAGNDFGRSPEKGDISICLDCQAILVFNEDLTIRAITQEEWDKLEDTHKLYIRMEQFKCLMIMNTEKASKANLN